MYKIMLNPNKLAKIRHIITDYFCLDQNLKRGSGPPPPKLRGDFKKGGSAPLSTPSTTPLNIIYHNLTSHIIMSAVNSEFRPYNEYKQHQNNCIITGLYKVYKKSRRFQI